VELCVAEPSTSFAMCNSTVTKALRLESIVQPRIVVDRWGWLFECGGHIVQVDQQAGLWGKSAAIKVLPLTTTRGRNCHHA
jgi:hypothetical protein